MTLVLTYHISADDVGKSVGDFLKEREISRKGIVAIKHQGGKIEIDGSEHRTSYVLESPALLRVTFPKEQVSENLFAVDMALSIVYEDEYLLVVDKQAGLPVMPSGKHDIGLANGLLAYFQKQGLDSTVHFVNRLDKDTSGLMMVAKYKHIHYLLSDKLQMITRKYLALVEGITLSLGTINLPIYRPDATSIKRVVDERGKNAITHYHRLDVLHAGQASLISCKLETGRTHQIRVHLSYMNHPIINDPLYGKGSPHDQQLLHSYYLSFIHPISRKTITLETGIPSRFKESIL